MNQPNNTERTVRISELSGGYVSENGTFIGEKEVLGKWVISREAVEALLESQQDTLRREFVEDLYTIIPNIEANYESGIKRTLRLIAKYTPQYQGEHTKEEQ